MRHFAAIAVLSLTGSAVAPLAADSLGAPGLPAPVEAGTSAGQTAPEAKPVLVDLPEPAAAPVTIDATTVTAPAPAKKPESAALEVTAAPAAVPAEAQPARSAYRPPVGQVTNQYHSAYRVNRVVVELPAGVRVITRKDWYTDKIIVTYAANPYTNWRGVKPDAFVFVHEKETLRIVPSGTKYLPEEITVYVRPSVTVQVM